MLFSPFQWQVTLSLARKKAKVYLYAQLTYQARYLLDLQLFKPLIVIRSGFVLSIYGYVWPTIKNLVNGAGLRRDQLQLVTRDNSLPLHKIYLPPPFLGQH